MKIKGCVLTSFYLYGNDGEDGGQSCERRQFVGSSLALAATWPLRGFAFRIKGVGDVPAKSLAGGDIVLPGSSIEALAAGLRGEVLLAGSQDYDRTRRLWNASFDRKPALIARCTGAADVQQAVNFAREHQLLTAVRAGGHSYSGKSSCDGGLMIDLQSMQGVRVDPESKRAYVESGSLLGQLDHECAAFQAGHHRRHRLAHGCRGPYARRRPRPARAGASDSPATMSPPSIS